MANSEARYARAVALARNGQKDAARDALREFANGEYRHDDAIKLLDKLQVDRLPALIRVALEAGLTDDTGAHKGNP